jgi:hypothetical protein
MKGMSPHAPLYAVYLILMAITAAIVLIKLAIALLA